MIWVKAMTRSGDTTAMAWRMGRKLTFIGLSLLGTACGDDTGAVVTTTFEDTSATAETTSDISDTFESISVTLDEGPFSEVGPEVTSMSDTFETTDPSDTFETDSVSVSVSVSDTFDSSVSDTFDSSDTVVSDSNDTSSSVSSDTDTKGTSTSLETTDPTTTDSTVTDPTDTATTTDPTDATTTDPTDATTTDSDSDTGVDTDGDGDGFVDPPAFGTNPLDFDLVGVWGLNWDPSSGFDSVLDVDDAGNFMWTETSADCTSSTLASGFLWVEGSQVVMHVEVWERPLPWDTEPVLGETFDPPFRLRMSFSLQGSGADDYLTFGAPGTITATAPYTGESYVQIAAEGDFLAGDWHGEAQLDAIPAGETAAVTIVRDSYNADLQLEFAADDPEGFGTRAITTQYFLPEGMGTQSTIFLGGNWGCQGGCPDPSGLTLINGGNLYTYGPYGAQEHLLTFETGRTFRSNVVSDCL
jgi:hypothetical protein